MKGISNEVTYQFSEAQFAIWVTAVKLSCTFERSFYQYLVW
jgi:hypothetical protein